VVGSNIFNIMGGPGISGLVSIAGVTVSQAVLQLDVPIMIAVACLPVFFTGHLIARWKGALFLACYCACTASIVIAVTMPSMARTFRVVMLGFVIPLTVVTLLVGSVRYVRNGSGTQSPLQECSTAVEPG